MKKLILLLALALMQNLVYSQMDKKTFSSLLLKDIENDFEGYLEEGDTPGYISYTYILSLCENSFFKILIEYVSASAGFGDFGGDIEKGNYLYAWGKYDFQDSTLLLTSIYTKAQWEYKPGNGFLIPVKTSDFMKGKILEEAPSYHIRECSLMSYDSTAHEKIDKFQKENITQNVFEDGVYQNNYYDSPFLSLCLSLTKDSTFYLYYSVYSELRKDLTVAGFNIWTPSRMSKNDILLSSGTWQRNGNILELYDTSLEHVFYVLIHKTEELQVLMFGDMTKELFYKVPH